MKKLLSSFAAAFFIASNAHAAPMTLNVHEADLRSTIIMVARAARLNVSVDDSVTGTISMSIIDTEPEKILEIIAKTKNLNLLRDGDIYIMTSHVNSGALMQTYVLPVRYGDPENLRKAIILSLDPDIETIPDHMTRVRNSDGSYTYRYSYRENDSDDSSNNRQERIKREERVLVSPDVNALVLFGTEAEYERAKKLLAEIDVELKQVSVEAKILAIDKDASKNLGIDWMWSTLPQYPEREITHYDAKYDSRGNQTASEYFVEEYTRKANDNTGYGIIQFGRGPEGIPFEFYYGARINALVTNGKARILSRPNVTTIQGHEAVINVGSSVPIPKESITNSTTTTSLEYRDAGIILKYTPRINADGTITATIHTEVSTPQYVADLKAYRFNTRSADTTVTVRDGEPMVIGGLIGAEEAKSISKIPFLGDLPLLGALFRSHKKSKSESELMIFITAHVLKGAAR
ncbi:MAG: type II secretion system protein GspD [Selenomonadaceae bacterium]|nr:type II secretion system protein GspD [Selenomonadaceae bacterium]